MFILLKALLVQSVFALNDTNTVLSSMDNFHIHKDCMVGKCFL